MKFQLWEHNTNTSGISRCFANRTQEQVRAEFHDMAIGERRMIQEDDTSIIDIIRVE